MSTTTISSTTNILPPPPPTKKKSNQSKNWKNIYSTFSAEFVRENMQKCRDLMGLLNMRIREVQETDEQTRTRDVERYVQRYNNETLTARAHRMTNFSEWMEYPACGMPDKQYVNLCKGDSECWFQDVGSLYRDCHIMLLKGTRNVFLCSSCVQNCVFNFFEPEDLADDRDQSLSSPPLDGFDSPDCLSHISRNDFKKRNVENNHFTDIPHDEKNQYPRSFSSSHSSSSSSSSSYSCRSSYPSQYSSQYPSQYSSLYSSHYPSQYPSQYQSQYSSYYSDMVARSKPAPMTDAEVATKFKELWEKYEQECNTLQFSLPESMTCSLDGFSPSLDTGSFLPPIINELMSPETSGCEHSVLEEGQTVLLPSAIVTSS